MATISIGDFTTGPRTFGGLNSYVYAAKSNAEHNCRIQLDHGNSCNATISIVQAGSVNSTLATVTVLPQTLGSGQTSTILMCQAICAVGDRLTFTITSSAAEDQGLNVLKSTINVHSGALA